MGIDIKVSPVRKKTIPQYPDQYSVQLNQLLLANKPLRWSAAPVAGTVLSAVVLLGLAGCGAAEERAYPPTPLFEHGEGIGVYGCVAIAAPMFLSENDAFAILSDEFAKLGMTVIKGGPTAENIQIPQYDPCGEWSGNKEITTAKGSLTFDFSVKEESIVMEYVSKDNALEWEHGDMLVSVSSTNYKELARTLNNSLNTAYTQSVQGIFYDPAESARYYSDDFSPTFDREQEIAKARERALAALRAQIKDFIAWLAAQGII